MPDAPQLTVEFDVEDGTEPDWDRPELEALARSIVQRECPPGGYSLTIHLVSDETIRELNREHRGVDSATDVLSFPLHDPTGMQFVLPPDHPINLGDVVISRARAQAQAEEFGHSQRREMAYLAAHGLLHILGYDHEDPDDQQRMRAREEEALGALGLRR